MTPPAWVHKRDGRLVPFEADKISRSLFAATEQLGRSDAFLARELTDGVLHFLSSDAEGSIPTTADIAELVAKVVRELGQPTLARAYADHKGRKSAQGAATRPISVRFVPTDPLPSVLAECRRAYALGAVFTRDLVAAQHDGLLTIGNLDAPLELAASAPAPLTPLLERLLEVRQLTAGVVALDGVEHALARSPLPEQSATASFVRDLEIGLRGTGLGAVVNLNVAVPPPWADDLAEGPLFAGQRSDTPPDRLAVLAEVLLQALAHGPARARIDWHLGERDFTPASAERLRRAARLAAEGAALAFVFDRPRRPIALAEGIDRKHPALLLTVGLHLPRLAGQSGAGADPALFLRKLGSLARLALSAAVQKRDFLRRHAADRPALTRGFFLDRARLMVAVVGLDRAVRLLTGKGLCDGKGPEFGRQVVQRLRDVLREDGRACLIDTCLDAPAGFTFDATGLPDPSAIAGVTAWDAAAPVKAQLRAAGVLHAVADGGTAALLPDEERAAGAEQVAEWLRLAWSQTDVGRLCFVRPAPAQRQLTLPE
ncbi:MAG TPA: ATP cone domain-containing protein [Gemmataceae bacterium]|nr:ATP cone domain-containing protein [Gemmataceae bacterium]